MNIKERFYIYFNSTANKDDQDKLFEYIWENYSSYIKSIIFKYKSNIPNIEIDDIHQEIFIKIYNNLDKYNPAYSFTSWINKIIKNYMIDINRKQYLEIDHQDIEFVSNILNPLDSFLNKEDQNAILYEISKLKNEDKLIINDIIHENKKYIDIADELGITEQNLRVRIHRIKTKLSKKLENKI